MRVSYSQKYTAVLPEGHIFPMGKFKQLRDLLVYRSVIKDADIVEPGLVDFGNLCSVHTPRYADAVWNGALAKKEVRRMGLPWSKSLAIRSRVAVQGTINAGMMALQDGIAGNLAGGTHHAMPDFGEGFCVFNDVAVAIRVLKQTMWVQKVLIIDCDVHQGNGNAAFFADDPDVFTFSIHGEKNYPFKKPASTLDVGLPDGTEDREYLDALERALQHIFTEFTPDLVFYLGGIDPLESDHFGRLSLTLNGLRERETMVVSEVLNRQLPLALLLSGGYAPTVAETAQAHAVMYEQAVLIAKSTVA
ncbi:MAG: histone deacetylase [Balneolaceae bacterium]